MISSKISGPKAHCVSRMVSHDSPGTFRSGMDSVRSIGWNGAGGGELALGSLMVVGELDSIASLIYLDCRVSVSTIRFAALWLPR